MKTGGPQAAHPMNRKRRARREAGAGVQRAAAGLPNAPRIFLSSAM
ncbi:hypothetical protein BDI24065_02158 [Burkholderia diffusa]|uniref:Uncharacterized protein n=1 Tax=Burkholderia diffusa TaxID=488732 RepID=A0A6P2JWJ4_9BURK|nr:hypothetical protein BDI24065_02158 [Burkholderia diffusa]